MGLLDTHTFMWWDGDRSKLSPAALAFIQDPTNTIMLSVVSVLEILIKVQLGKLRVNAPLATIVAQQQANGIHVLPVSLNHVLTLDRLPAVHKDPFDRLLVAQAMVEGAVLVSTDTLFSSYPVTVFW